MADDYSADIGTTGSIALGGQVGGALETPGDRDWFAVSLTAGEDYLIQMDGGLGGPLVYDIYIWGIHDSAGVLQPNSQDGGAGPHARVFFTPAASGTHYIAAGSLSGETGGYTVSLNLHRIPQGDGDDNWLIWTPGTATVDGGAGNDTLSFVEMRSLFGLSADLDSGKILTEYGLVTTFSDIENVTGSTKDDMIHGDAGANVLRGLGGHDLLQGRGGADRLDGGAGNDTASYRDSAEAIDASLLRGRGWAGDAAGDRFVFIENLTGGAHDDRLTGDHGGNGLRGGDGDDWLMGNGGNDYIDGGDGIDTAVFGYARALYSITDIGNDRLVTYIGPGPGDGADRLANVEILHFADGDLIL